VPLKRASYSKLHLYLGVLVSLPLLLIAVTGILLGFLAPYRIEPALNGTLTAGQILAELNRQLPAQQITVLRFPESPHAPLRARLADDRLVYLHPESGQVLAIHKKGEIDWLEFLYRIHRGKILGYAGQVTASILGVSVLVLAVLGVLIRRSRKKNLTKERTLRAHRTLGFPFGLLVGAVGVGGALLNFSGPLTQWLDPVPSVVPGHSQRAPDLDALSRAAVSAYPNVPLESIRWPRDKTSAIQFEFGDTSRVYLDPMSGAVVKTASWSSHWTRSLAILHTGKIVGAFRPLWTTLVGVTLLGLLLSGLFLAKHRLRGRLNAW
jgi:uncharacterized iron-regulated membrane protein